MKYFLKILLGGGQFMLFVFTIFMQVMAIIQWSTFESFWTPIGIIGGFSIIQYFFVRDRYKMWKELKEDNDDKVE